MENVEISLGMVNIWMKKFSEEGSVLEIDPMILRDTLKEYGADFKKKANTFLCEYTQEASRPGMELVWGIDRYKKYIEWCRGWTNKFESVESHRELPKLKKRKSPEKSSNSKIGGMLQFFHHITSYAVGGLSFEDLSSYLTVMDRNGYLWQEGAFDDMRTRVNIKGEAKKIGSIPPGFAADFWRWLRNSANEQA